jgi:hypothetical protein
VKAVALQREVRIEQPVDHSEHFTRSPKARAEFTIEGASLDGVVGHKVPEFGKVGLYVFQRGKDAGAAIPHGMSSRIARKTIHA